MARIPFNIADAIWPDVANARQPQQLLKITNDEIAKGLVSFVYPISGYDVVSRRSLVYGSSVTRVSGPKGQSWRGAGTNSTIDIGASGGISTVLDQTKPWSFAARIYVSTLGVVKFLAGDYAASGADKAFHIYLNDNNTYYAEGYHSNGSLATSVTGGTVTVGYHDLLCVFSGGTNFNVRLWVDGVLIGTGANAGLDQHAGSSFRLMGPGAYNAAYGFQDDLVYAALWQGDKANYARQLSSNPWLLLESPGSELFNGLLPASDVTFLTGSDSTQANASTSGAISQTHILTGADAAQANTSTSGAISQTHILAGADADQANASTSGAISQTHILAGADAAQANASTSGAISQTHILAGADAAQANASTSGAISQTHILTGADAAQANTSTSGAISLSSTIVLTGSDAAQANASTSGAIIQTHILTGADAAQANASTSGAISQTHILAGADAVQANASTSGAISLLPDSSIDLACTIIIKAALSASLGVNHVH